MSQTNVPSLPLLDGHLMPQLGLGVWQARDGEEVTAVTAALETGYRHVDTAAIYKNEAGVGRGIREAGVPREELFVTTKCWNDDIRAGRARAALETSLGKLQLDYVDLYLLHWPVEGGIAAYRELERAQADGLIRSLGVSNYLPAQLDELTAATDMTPAVNQIEFHPYLQQRDITEYCVRYGIAVTAWSPLMQGHFLEEPLLAELAGAYGKTAAQVLLRWDVQRGVVTIPKSVNPTRIAENFDVFDFELSDDDVSRIDALGRGEEGRYGQHPAHVDF